MDDSAALGREEEELTGARKVGKGVIKRVEGGDAGVAKGERGEDLTGAKDTAAGLRGREEEDEVGSTNARGALVDFDVRGEDWSSSFLSTFSLNPFSCSSTTSTIASSSNSPSTITASSSAQYIPELSSSFNTLFNMVIAELVFRDATKLPLLPLKGLKDLKLVAFDFNEFVQDSLLDMVGWAVV